jgi:gluconate 5-dehydrogenase
MTQYTNLFNLTGKIALITGSSQGLGFILAQGLGQAGAAIVLNGREVTKLEAAVEQLKANGLKVAGYPFDVRDETAIINQIQKIEQEVGEIDILVNNAGIQIRAPLENFNADDFRKILDINLTGAFLVTKAVAQGMIGRRAGKIINICSVQSELARPTIAPYTAAKGGLKMLTKAMATDWGKYNIQVNGLAPGYFKSEMTRTLYENENFNSWLCSRTPANRWGNPEELIGAAIFLASPASSYVNGQILFVDGGLVACV